MVTVTATELKYRAGEVLKRVQRGEAITVTLRGVQVAEVVPAPRRRARVAVRERERTRVAAVRAQVGRFRGLATVEEFLAAKHRETARER
jgi:prevent-host-death family protein